MCNSANALDELSVVKVVGLSPLLVPMYTIWDSATRRERSRLHYGKPERIWPQRHCPSGMH